MYPNFDIQYLIDNLSRISTIINIRASFRKGIGLSIAKNILNSDRNGHTNKSTKIRVSYKKKYRN